MVIEKKKMEKNVGSFTCVLCHYLKKTNTELNIVYSHLAFIIIL